MTLCEDDGFGGDCQRVDNDINYLGNENIGDNHVSSASVRPVETCTVDDQRVCIPLIGCFGACTVTCCREAASDLNTCSDSDCD